MSQKTLRMLVGALVVLVVLWGGTVLLAHPDAAPAVPPQLAAFLDGVGSRDSLRALRVEGPDGVSLELAPADGGWTVDGLPADSGNVARFLDVLSEAHVAELAARSTSNHARMGVADGDTYTLAVEAGAYSGSILVGDQGTRYGTTYVRAPGHAEVYLVDGDLRTPARRDLDAWRSKRVLGLDTARVARIDVTRNGEQYAVVRGDSTWTFADGSATDPDEIRSLLGEYRNLQATGFVGATDSLATLPPGGSVV
ncbi:MAG TPA: DUF4340 domain-containing protein, partial [Longimicrobiales bacterium]|nr:DUF4340 domain-containing protein [Longimicrobiales bacterium]